MNAMTRKKHGVPAQLGGFFEGIFAHLISKGRGSIFSASHDPQADGAALILFLGQTIHYKYNASDAASLSRVSPNDLLMWRLIEQGYARGYQRVDFGRTASDNERLVRYQQPRGVTRLELPCHFAKCSASDASGRSQRVFKKNWKVLPYSWTNSLGPRFMKRPGLARRGPHRAEEQTPQNAWQAHARQ